MIAEAEKLSQINGILSGVSSIQTAGLVVVMSVLPCLMMYASYALYRKHYILDEPEYERIVAVLKERRGE